MHNLYPVISISLLLALSSTISVAQESKPIQIITPKKQVEAAKSAAIDTEKFQVGLFTGFIAVEDFSSDPISGISLSYLISQNFLLQARYGQADIGVSSFEKREGFNFLTSSQREFNFVSLGGGYKLYTARSFFSSKYKYDSDVYVTAEIEDVEFAGESNTGLVLGMSYRVVFTDWLVTNFDFRNHIVKSRDVFGPKDQKNTQNTEFSIGFNVMF